MIRSGLNLSSLSEYVENFFFRSIVISFPLSTWTLWILLNFRRYCKILASYYEYFSVEVWQENLFLLCIPDLWLIFMGSSNEVLHNLVSPMGFSPTISVSCFYYKFQTPVNDAIMMAIIKFACINIHASASISYLFIYSNETD